MNNGYPIICLSCATRGSVNKVTAGLVCRCGGQVDIYLDTPAQRRLVASRGPQASFAAWMGRTAAPEGMESSDGSNEYAGPGPHPTEMSNHEGRIRCPDCHGSGNDVQDGTEPCRACGGDGYLTPTTTARDPEVYRHRYPPDGERNKQTKVPFIGQRRTAYSGTGLDEPLAPSEGHPPPSEGRRPSQSVQQVSDEANAEIDRRLRERSGAHRHPNRHGRREAMVRRVLSVNQGLTRSEAESLVDETRRRYPEVR